jgi:hypothetical protein
VLENLSTEILDNLNCVQNMLKEHGPLLFYSNMFVGCLEGEVRTRSRLVVAWHSYVYDGGGVRERLSTSK